MRMLERTGVTGKQGFGLRSPPAGLAGQPHSAHAGSGRGDGSLTGVLEVRVDLQKVDGATSDSNVPPAVVAAAARSGLVRVLEQSGL